MTSTICRSVVAVATGIAVLGSVGAQAQETFAPSALLPMESLWTTALAASPSAAPVHDAGRLFVAQRDGHVTAINIDDGAVVWDVVRPVVGELAIGGELLYVASRRELHGLETATGQPRWSVPLEAPLSAPLVWNNNWLIAALETQVLLALHAETGELVWRQNMGGAVDVAPSLAADRMYVSLDSGDVVALQLMTGAAVWKRRLDGRPSRILPLDDLFVGATDNHFYCLSSVDGSTKWRWRAGGDIVGLPAVDEKRVYFTSLDNMLWALNRSNGVQQWRQPLVARPTAGPRHAGDLLVLGGMSQDLKFFDPEEGEPFGRVRAGSELAFPPVSLAAPGVGHLLITVTGDGQLRALRRATGPTLLDPAVTAILGADPADADTVDASTPTETTPSATTAPASAPVAGATEVTSGSRPAIGPEYAIQVSAFANGDTASGLVDRLLEQGYPAYAIAPGPTDESALHRVRIGDYPDRAAAEAVGRQVEDEEALDWYVIALP